MSSNRNLASRLASRLLRKNISTGRVVGFALSNFIGLLIVCGALQMYIDSRPLWQDEENFLNTDYLVVNKQVSAANTLGMESSSLSPSEISELKSQPWVRAAAPFTPAAYRVDGSVAAGGRAMRTALFFEAIPDRFIDVPPTRWQWHEGDTEVPIIISKDYLTLYNFGFATAAGMPQMTEGMMSGIPLRLTLSSEDGSRSIVVNGRVAGYSNRLNTILVPQAFIDATNAALAPGVTPDVSRMIIDVNSPGDVAIGEYLAAHSLEQAGDKGASSATFLLRTVVGVVMSVGILVTLLSFFILLLSISLLMEKNRDKIHTLLLLGFPLGEAAAPYRRVVLWGCGAALMLTICALCALRGLYAGALAGLGGEVSFLTAGLTWGAVAAFVLSGVTVVGNLWSINRRVRSAWRVKR